MTMKLQNEYEYATQMATSKVTDEALYEHAMNIAHTGASGIKKLDVRIANDLKYATMPVNVICDWYAKYNCNDNHITTLYKRILKEHYPKTWDAVDGLSNLGKIRNNRG